MSDQPWPKIACMMEAPERKGRAAITIAPNILSRTGVEQRKSRFVLTLISFPIALRDRFFVGCLLY